MFAVPLNPRLAKQHEEARRRRAAGQSVKEIARSVGVAPSTVSVWCRDIELSPDQQRRNRLRGAGARSSAWSEKHRARRREFQEEGRRRAREGDMLHAIGCMLYWAEGAKERNTVCFANSDPAMIEVFARFLRECFGIEGDSLRFRVNVYLGNGLELDEIEAYWAGRLGCGRDRARKPVVNHFPTSSSGKRLKKLPHGVCTVTVNRSTWLVQHIFGAIQEYSGVDQPQWLDGPPRKKPGSTP